MPLRSGLLPWNEPAQAKLLQWTCPMRAVLTSDFTYSVEHAAIVHARAQTSVARNRCLSMVLTSDEPKLSGSQSRRYIVTHEGGGG